VVNRKILVVDDDRDWLDAVVELLEREGYSVRAAETFPDARVAIDQFEPDVLITDVRLGEYNGVYLLLRSRSRYPEMVSIIVSGYDDPVIAREAKQEGAYDFLVKPVEGRRLLDRVGEALASRGKRRWPRKPAPVGFSALVSGRMARLVDISYGGIRIELPFAPAIGPPLEVDLPALGRTVMAHAVWTHDDEASGAQLCGAALTFDDETATAWRHVVDGAAAAG
jgi:DNA-binding response OmpR family regulator